MQCLKCGKKIPDAYFADQSPRQELKGDRFTCPHCGASHIRREIGRLPSGAPLHTYRLWGHPLSTPEQSAEGPERRRNPRNKPAR